jgi:hypothetical protein
MKRKTIVAIGLVAALGAAVWHYNGKEHIAGLIQQYVENGEFNTLKARFTPEQIMESHRKELLADSQHSFQEPGIKYHPYTLMEVKYTSPDSKSREGMILWSLIDGELVLNTDTWEKTHGFEDAINAGATRNDFKIMHNLAKHRGNSTVDQLQKDLHIEKEMLLEWLDSTASKQLIVQRGNEVQLHFQDPKIPLQPETKLTDWIVKKPYNHSQRQMSNYSNGQIQKIAKAAYGDTFTIRTTTEVYLPVYSIGVLNPDGSTATSYWNALTGQKMPQKYSFHR